MSTGGESRRFGKFRVGTANLEQRPIQLTGQIYLLDVQTLMTEPRAGKIKGLRGAKLGNPYLRWAYGEAAVISKRDHYVIAPLAQRLEAQMNGNKFKANTVLAIKLARASYFMLKNKTVFDPERLIASMKKCFRPGRREPAGLTGRAKKARPLPVTAPVHCASSTAVCVGPASSPAVSTGTCDQVR